MNSEMMPLLEVIKNNDRSYDYDKITRSFEYAKKMHEGQFRLSGEPYISHPVSVATIVAELGLDTDSICAALLHDTVEDCADKTDLDTLTKLFGVDVAMLVDGMTKIIQVQIADKEEAHIENIRKMLLAMHKDIRVIFIKLCDRLHNMRTLSAKKEDRQRQIALETMHIYAPLAHRLGIQQIKQELENILGLQRGIGMIMPYQQCAGLRVFVCSLHDQALLSHLNHYNIRSPANQVPANISFSLDIQ